MKIFFVNTTKMWGGGEKWHFETACAMKERGHDVAILARPGGDLFKKSVLSGIRTITVSVSNISFLNPFRLLSIAQLLRKENPDILILNFSADIKTVGIAAKNAGIRNIVYRRGSAIPIRNTLLNRLLYKKVITRIIANSNETRHTILQHNKNLFPLAKIHVIYNGINIRQFDSIPVVQLYQRQGSEVIIGNVGRMVHQKGQKYLIAMAALLQKNSIDFKILIAGEGPLEKSLKHMAGKAGVEKHLVFLGFVDNIKAFMENIDIFVLPSLWEGFGYVLVEAMACSKPIVAFNISSNPEIVAHHETGFLVDNQNIEVFTQQVELLISDRGLRESMGKAGRKRAEEVFDMDVTEKKIEQLLMSL
jgi:glycosyltransferase involved in cell wall biosynthesis